ncbi:hypothetical protein K435DRAFT_804009 [Dendrothele bispora CBS 962.96]|uniref:Uncharacterized protein n=1 Tax=Dendrothele bispora (strain CBS 962.96) TaxID=1314807 RepID=A0A4V4HDM3_DENBC|nr:hypothetical protein K435DRAFT_804009 [Dendrothele bispora CBS 962.96]
MKKKDRGIPKQLKALVLANMRHYERANEPGTGENIHITTGTTGRVLILTVFEADWNLAMPKATGEYMRLTFFQGYKGGNENCERRTRIGQLGSRHLNPDAKGNEWMKAFAEQWKDPPENPNRGKEPNTKKKDRTTLDVMAKDAASSHYGLEKSTIVLASHSWSNSRV